MSKKIVLKMHLNCDKCKQKVMKSIAGTEGVDSVQTDMKEQKITVIGDADPVCITNKLKKLGHPELVSVGPAKEPEKKQPEKKSEEKKEAPKEEKKEAPKPNPAPNITYVFLPRYCEPCCGRHCDPCCGGYPYYKYFS